MPAGAGGDTGRVLPRDLTGLRRAVRGGGAAAALRIRWAAWSIVQCAIGASAAWLLARSLLGHPAPVFAGVAAMVCLGVGGPRLRRVAELSLGVTIGVALGDVLVAQIGRGWWQLGLVVALGMVLAQLFGGGQLLTAQAGLQGIFLIALPQADAGLSRWLDALLGGLVALGVAAALPADPLRPVRPAAAALVAEFADVVRQAAAAIRRADADLAEDALHRARATQTLIDRWDAALRDGEEITRVSPLRRRRRADLARYRHALVGVDRAVRNLRVGIRRIAAELDRDEAIPAPIADVLVDLATALGALQHEFGQLDTDGVPAGALRALAARLDPDRLCAESLSSTVVVAQLRSAVVDLLTATGTDPNEARALLPR